MVQRTTRGRCPPCLRRESLGAFVSFNKHHAYLSSNSLLGYPLQCWTQSVLCTREIVLLHANLICGRFDGNIPSSPPPPPPIPFVLAPHLPSTSLSLPHQSTPHFPSPTFPGEEDATYINWMMVKKGPPQRCECGHWFELIEAKPTKM